MSFFVQHKFCVIGIVSDRMLFFCFSLTRQLRNMEVEVKKVENGNRNSGTFHKLQLELSKLKEELADSKEKLSKARLSNLNRLVQVATHRERVRDLEGDLEEVR